MVRQINQNQIWKKKFRFNKFTAVISLIIILFLIISISGCSSLKIGNYNIDIKHVNSTDTINNTDIKKNTITTEQNVLNSGIVGKWKFENQNGYTIYIFNIDGTSTKESNLFGKSYYTYTLLGEYINLISKDTGVTESLKYRFENENNIVITDKNDPFRIPLNFERVK